MRQSRAPLSGLDKFFAAQFSAGCITSMSELDLRQAQEGSSIERGIPISSNGPRARYFH